MTIQWILDAIDSYCKNHKKFLLKLKLKKHCPRVYKMLLEQTSFLDKFESIKDGRSNLSVFERIFCLKNNLKDRPLCQKCHEKYVEGFNIGLNTYRKWCCPSCQASDPECVNKSKQTRKIVYGKENYNGIEKARVTRGLKNHGHWNPEDFDEKVKATKVKNGHNPNWTNPEKQKATVSKRLQENPNYWVEREQKSKETKVRNGHDPNWNNREKFKETIGNFSEERREEIVKKRRETNLERYDVESPMQVKKFHDQAKETFFKHYHVNSSFLLPGARENAIVSKKKVALKRIHSDTKYTQLFTDEEFIQNRNPDKAWMWHCNNCGYDFPSVYNSGRHSKCPKCERPIGSGDEQVIFEEVQKFYSDKIIHGQGSFKVIPPYQLDFYFPEKRVAVEHNGLYWHCETEDKDSKMRHFKKTQMCEQQGIRLLHIFGDELNEKLDVVVDTLKQVLCKKRELQHDNLNFKILNYEEASEFHLKHNLLGGSKSRFNILLREGESEVALMSLSKCKFNKNYEFQIDRFSSTPEISPSEAFKVLCQYVKDNIGTSIVYYYARRLPTLELNELELKLVRRNKPQFWYTDFYIRLDKNSTTKQLAKAICQNYSEDKTITKNMLANGFSKVWDCGTDVYEVL